MLKNKHKLRRMVYKRKPRQRAKQERKKNKSHKKHSVDDEDDTACLYCNGLCSKSAETWIQCTLRHLSCTGLEKDSHRFF